VANSSPNANSLIRDLIDRYQIDIIQLCELYITANYKIAEFSKDSPVIVFDAHNNETAILKRLSEIEKNPLKKMFYLSQSIIMKRYEKRIATAVDRLIAVSSEEAIYFKNFNPTVYIATNGVDHLTKNDSTERR